LFVLGRDVDQSIKLAVEFVVLLAQLLDLALDQRGGHAAVVQQLLGLQHLGVVLEKVRMLAKEVRDDGFQRLCVVVTHPVSL
jgi:hypothetical protein